MNASSVAYSELTRVLPWAIRARGYPFGTADRASFLVANAASLAPEVLADIAMLGERPGVIPRREWREGMLCIHAQGISWLEVGPALMDYCGAHAPAGGQVSCAVIGATEISLLPAILLVGADYGLSAVALLTQGGVLRWTLLAWSNDTSERPVILSGEGRSQLDRQLAGAIDLAGVPEDFEGARLVAWRRPQLTLQTPGANAQDPRASIQTAFACGIPVAPEVLEDLYELEKITWAPTSERSRAQAGYQPKPLGQSA